MGLANGDDLFVADAELGEAEAGFCRGERCWGAAVGIQPVQALIGELGEHQRSPGGDCPRAAAVLVHPGAGVPRRRQDVDRYAVAAGAHGVTAGLARSGFEPPDVVVDPGAAADRMAAFGEIAGGDR